MNQSDMPTPPLTASPNKDVTMRDPSPAPSSSTLSSVVTVSAPINPAEPAQPAQKKRKLTFAEKEQQRAEKEERQRIRDEQKAQKEEGKRLKDEEKRRKKEDKEAKDREKDLERQRKENEKLKKERVRHIKTTLRDMAHSLYAQAQLKISFFAKPQNPTSATLPLLKSNPSVGDATSDMDRHKSLPAEPEDVLAVTTVLSEATLRRGSGKSDYERKFLPFQLPSHTTCAPSISHPSLDAETSQQAFDKFIENPPTSLALPPSNLFSAFERVSRGLWQPNAREVIESLNGSTSQRPIDLTDIEPGKHHSPKNLLEHITIRHLHFAEDVRPPYVGSYTKAMSPSSSSKLRKNPFSRLRKDTNYDYDSEAEWDEPEEGEDLLSDGEDDEESVGAPDEMEDFLDEDEGGPKKRLLITGDLKPISTGLCWDGSSQDDAAVDLESMKLDFFLGMSHPSLK